MMTDKKILLPLGGILFSLIALAACSAPTPTATPTLDLNPIRSEVAATVLAQVSQTLAAQPTQTPIPSPTLPRLEVSVTATLPFLPTPTVSGTPPTLVPTPELENRAAWAAQSIADNTIFAPGQAFTLTWTLKNVGASTWTAGYLLRYYSGEPFGAAKEALLGREVLPGDTIEISLAMKAPVKPGDYRTDWVLSTEKRSNFKEPVFLKITVANPPTATPTATTAPTATP